MTNPTDTNPDGTPTAAVLKLAVQAFKKRLKLTRLDDESKVGRSPMSGGSRSVVAGIRPPDQFPAGGLGPPGNDGPVEARQPGILRNGISSVGERR